MTLQVAFLNFTLSLYKQFDTKAVHYVDVILSSCVNMLLRHLGYDSETATPSKLDEFHAVESVVEICSGPVRSLGLQVLSLEHYANLVQLLHFQGRKKVSVGILKIVLENDVKLSTEEDSKRLLRLLTPLLQDDPPEMGGANGAGGSSSSAHPRSSGSSMGGETEEEGFATEQELICKLVHQVEHADTDKLFMFYTTLRSFFGPGGPRRMTFTLPTLL